MKKYLLSTSRKFLALGPLAWMLAFPVSYAAKPIAELAAGSVGRAFLVEGGKTTLLKAGDPIFDMAEIMTESGGQIKIIGSNKVTYHLTGSAQVKFLNRTLELKRGAVWFQSTVAPLKAWAPYVIQTANAQIDYWAGEGIVSYDFGLSKTQFLSINGSMEFSNLSERDWMAIVNTGQFSFIDNQEDEGAPRKPTTIGEHSYKQFTSLFPKVKPITESTAIAIASEIIPTLKAIESENRENKEIKGKHGKKKEQRSPASLSPEKLQVNQMGPNHEILRKAPEEIHLQKIDLKALHSAELNKIKKAAKARRPTWSPSMDKKEKSPIMVRIYGLETTEKKHESSAFQRKPASIGEAARDEIQQYKKEKQFGKESEELLMQLHQVPSDAPKSH